MNKTTDYVNRLIFLRLMQGYYDKLFIAIQTCKIMINIGLARLRVIKITFSIDKAFEFIDQIEYSFRVHHSPYSLYTGLR
jgi:hypothetical protein